MIRSMRAQPYPDRSKDCQLALEVHLQELIDKATAAGWERSEAIAAIANLAINLVAANMQNRQVDRFIARALGRIEH